MLLQVEMDCRVPIGVFDSGLGGLTVLGELTRALPHEDFLYLGDVARLPYGTKSASVVTAYARRCVDHLVNRGVKTVVVACNTATAMALPTLQQEYPIPIVGVIEPGVGAVLSSGVAKRRVLVLATHSTVKSEAYLREFYRQAPELIVEQQACPLLVPLVEEGWFDHPVSRAVIQDYLKPFIKAPLDAVLLGCTHYPLLTPSFQQVIPQIPLLHGGAKLAADLSSRLREKNLLAPAKEPGSRRMQFLATDRIQAHTAMVDQLFGESIQFEPVDL